MVKLARILGFGAELLNKLTPLTRSRLKWVGESVPATDVPVYTGTARIT